MLTPSQLLERLSRRLDLLKGGRDADPRQQTLRATIEWSYDLLIPAEQQLFARLSVFRGGCTLEAAEDVFAADLDALQSLVDKSLVRFTDERFWMLETIREYAWDKVEAACEADEIRQRHVDYFVDSVGSTVAHVSRLLPPDWGRRFESERANLRAAMGWALEEGFAEEACILAIAYAFLCRLRGPLSEGRFWLNAVLERGGSVTDGRRSRALRVAASLAELQRDHTASLAFAEEGLKLARSIGDPDAIATALVAVGVAEGSAANFERAEALETEALALFSATGDERQVRQTLGLLAWVAIARGDFARARELCERALRLSREASDDRGVVIALGNLGHALARQGDLDEALRLQGEALRLSLDHVDLSGVADSLVEIASLAVARSRYEEAAVMLGASAALREKTESVLDLVSQQVVGDALSALQAELEAGAFTSATARGRALSFDQAVEFALASID